MNTTAASRFCTPLQDVQGRARVRGEGVAPSHDKIEPRRVPVISRGGA
jgi:hypothetical protein